MKKFTIQDINDRKPKDSRLTAVSFDGYKKTPKGQMIPMVNVICSCGNTAVIRQPQIVSGRTKSCGCYEAEVLMKRNTKYSHHIPKLYLCWWDMMKRCYDSTVNGYKTYGGRGVTVCQEWHNYQNFLDWSLANGWKPGLQIDKDIKGDGMLYSPKNCCFVTGEVNSNYTCRSKKYLYKGETLTLGQIAEMENVNYKLLYQRVNKSKIPVEEAVLLDGKKLNKWVNQKYRCKA